MQQEVVVPVHWEERLRNLTTKMFGVWNVGADEALHKM